MSNSNHNGMWARSLDGVSHDVRLALRMVRRSPGFTATIALTLALGIGANAAIFGVINSLLLRPLPVADPSRLVTISSDSAIARGQAGVPWSFAMWEELQPHASLFDGAFAWTPARFDLAERGERQPVAGIFASGGYFAALGVAAIRGRTFTPADDRPGGGADGAVAIISYGLWQRRFAGADSVIGAPLVVDGATVTIVGVTAPEFRGLDVGSAFDVALPLETEPLIRGSRSALRTSRLLVMLRLKPGQSVEAGTATLRGLHRARLHAGAELGAVHARAGRNRRVTPRSGTIRAATVLRTSPSHDSDGCTARAADRVRQHRQPAAGTRHGAPVRARRSVGAWRVPRPSRAATADREPHFRGARCDRRARHRSVEQPGARGSVVDAGPADRAGSLVRLAGHGVHRGCRTRDGEHFRDGTGVPLHADRPAGCPQGAGTGRLVVCGWDAWSRHRVQQPRHPPDCAVAGARHCVRLCSSGPSRDSRACHSGSIPTACSW